MKKLESNFINMVMVLFLVAFVSSGSLGFIYSLTKERIDQAKLAKKIKAVKEVLKKDFTNSPNDEKSFLKDEDGIDLEIYPARDNDQLSSVAIKTYSNKAFNGQMWIMAGFLPDGSINKISVIEQRETPGLGTKINDLKFKKQFEGKNPASFKLKVKKDGGDVDAITAATISSRSVCDALNRAYIIFQKYLEKRLENE